VGWIKNALPPMGPGNAF